MAFRKAPKYAKISLKRRTKLIQLTLKSNLSISKAARMLHIKPSTAKLIAKRYKEEGTFFESKKSQKKREEKEQNDQQNRNHSQNMEPTEPNGSSLGTSFSNQENLMVPSYILTETPTVPMIIWSVPFQPCTWIYPYGFSQGL